MLLRKLRRDAGRSWMRQIIEWVRTPTGATLLGSVFAPIATSLTDYILTGGVSGLRTVSATLAGAMIGLLVGFMVTRKHKQKPERVPCRKSPRELIALIKGKTQIEADAVTGLYIGTWLRIQGRVYEVSEESEKISVDLKLEETSSLILILSDFDKIWRDRVKIISIGETVTVVGEIAYIRPFMDGVGYSVGHIGLKKCELVAG